MRHVAAQGWHGDSRRRLHLGIMQVLVSRIVSGSTHATLPASPSGFPAQRRRWAWVAVVTGVVFVLGIAGGAVQWFTSWEYSRQAVRFLGQAGRIDDTPKFRTHTCAMGWR